MSNAFVRKLAGYVSLSQMEERLLSEASAHISSVGAGRDLIKEGDKPGHTIVVLDGWAFRYKLLQDGSRQVLSIMVPGDFCYFNPAMLEPMDHSIATITGCSIASVPLDRMESLIIATPALKRGFQRAQLIDERLSRERIVTLGRRDAIERVAHLMLELHMRMRKVGLAAGKTCTLPLTQPILADALGLTPVHISRRLRNLREQGVMKLTSGTLTILDMRALESLAGLDRGFLTSSADFNVSVQPSG